MLKFKKQYKYNNYEKIKDWDREKIVKYFDKIDPNLLYKLLLEGAEQFAHPSYYKKDVIKNINE